MAMNLFSMIQNSKVRFGVLASVAFLLTATTTQAGFEWVPAEQPQPAAPQAAPAPAAPAPYVQPPSNELLSHDAQPLSPLPPLEGEGEIQAMPVPAPASAPEPAAEQGNVLKVKRMNVAPPEPMSPPPAAEPQPLEPTDTAVESMPQPLPELLPSTKTTVVMPEDAPDSARESVHGGNAMSIQAWPEGGNNAAVPMPVTSIEADQGPDVVGFGSDMPLALALQQIAPPGYAFSFGEDINPGSKVSWTGGKGWIDVMREMIDPLGLQADVRGKAIFIHHPQQSSHMELAPVTENEVAIVEEETIVIPPGDIAPASGEATQAPVTLSDETPAYRDEAETMPRIRRHGLKDPGFKPQEQPIETLSAIESAPSPAQQPAIGGKDVPKTMEIWEAEKGDSLKQTLSNWSKKGQFDLEWNAAHDYTLASDVLVAGRIDSAIKSLLTNGLEASDAPSLTFLKNTGTGSKLVIEGS